jgi:hypothetical protein
MKMVWCGEVAAFAGYWDFQILDGDILEGK